MPSPLDIPAGAVKAIGALRAELERGRRAVTGSAEAANKLRRTGERSIDLLERLDQRADQLLELGQKMESQMEQVLQQTERLVSLGERMADTGEGLLSTGNRAASASGEALIRAEQTIEHSRPVAQAIEQARRQLDLAGEIVDRAQGIAEQTLTGAKPRKRSAPRKTTRKPGAKKPRAARRSS